MAVPLPRLTRRRFLATAGGAAAGAVLLGACGDDDSAVDSSDGAGRTVPGEPGDGGTDTGSTTGRGLALAQFFGGSLFVAGQPARAPFGVVDTEALLPVELTPERLSVVLTGSDGAPVGEAIEVDRRAEGLPRAYFPLTFTVEEPGIYTARTEIDGEPAEMSLQVHDAGDVAVIQPGAPMPSVETPTTVDARGVTPICTAEPVCPLHDVGLPAALGEARPVALLVATPAFCQIAICGPVLDVLLEVAPAYPDIRFLHAEVYADPATDLTTHAPVVGELGLHFEPSLILVGADGTVVERLDTIYDRSELDERLGALT